jgi:tetratricopeptide (TPR) repeat protein
MQTEAIKKRIVQGLIEEITLIGSAELELVGHALIELIETKRLVHHGLNSEHRPSGYTVDSFTQDGSVVGEYSVEKSYFFDISAKDEPPKYNKIPHDIDHALAHSDPKKIYLISSQEEPESFRKKFYGTDYGAQYSDRLEIYDARELAKLIHQFSVANPAAADFFGGFFPGFQKDLENYEYYGRVPNRCENHQSEGSVLDAVQGHLSSGLGICVLHGLSGTGKTQAAIDYVHKNIERVGNYLWIHGEDLKKGASLSSIKRSRGGVPINVAGAFNSVPTLLVIDNLDWTVDSSTFSELEAGLKAGGIVLVTSTLNSPGSEYYVTIPPLTFDTAVRVLGENVDKLSKTAAEFINACSFSPLILATTRSVCKANGVDKEAFYQEILDRPELLANQDGVSIMRELLKRLDESSREALVKIANTGSGTHDSRFLGIFIGQNASINLQRLSILQSATAPGLLKVHDLICDAVREERSAGPVSEALEKFVGDRFGEMLPSVIRQIYLSEEQLLETHRARGIRNPDWLMYALMQADTDSKREVAAGVEDLQISDECSLAEVLCIVDAKEQYAYSIDDYDERKEYFRQCASDYEKAIAAGVREELRVELLHHRGKALRRTGSLTEALACFKELLTYRPDWHAAHGQISHLGMQTGADSASKAAGEASMAWLIDQMLFDFSTVPLRVSLAAIAHLRSYPSVVDQVAQDERKVSQIADVIAISALEGLDQFYEAFVAFTSKFAYEHERVAVALAESLPELLSVPPDSIDRRQWASACEALSNAARSASMAGKVKLASRLLASMQIFAQAIAASGATNPYTVRVVMKAFIAAELPAEALEICEKAAPGTNDHWILYRKSQALLALGKTQDAEDSGRGALDGALSDAKAREHLPSYYEQLSKCAEAGKDFGAAISFCESAINAGPKGKYLKHLQDRLATLAQGI